MAGCCYKFLNVPLTEEEMQALREIARKEGRSMGKQFRRYGVDRLVADALKLGVALSASADASGDATCPEVSAVAAPT